LYSEKRKISTEITHKEIEQLDDVFLQNFKILKSDLLVICNARKGAVSYSIDADLFLPKLEKAYINNDHILIYPSQEITENLFSASLSASIKAAST
jgi:hypothetical protein